MEARNLSILRIDDAYNRDPAAGLAEIEHLANYRVNRDAGDQQCVISNWRSALEFWSHGEFDRLPDLIVADVLFEYDASSPLAALPSYAGYVRFFPGGLMHLKPFAAIARWIGRPIGLGIHTASTKVWKSAWDQGRHPMAALAAHEAAEVAAILGEVKLPKGPAELWYIGLDWLATNSKNDPDSARQDALKAYRRKLCQFANCSSGAARVMLPPSEFVRLQSWLEDLSKAPAPIGDQSVELLYSEGNHDCIRLASLFADFDRIDTRIFSAGSFSDLSATEPWERSHYGQPQIGGFLTALGGMGQLFIEAAAIVEDFPLLARGQTRRRHLTKRIGATYKKQVVGVFAWMIQSIKWERRRLQAWQEGVRQPGWDLVNRTLGSATDSGRTLLFWLENLIKQARCSAQGEAFALEEVWQGMPDKNKTYYSDLLVQAGAFVRTDDGEYYVKGLRKGVTLPMPEILPIEFWGLVEVGDNRNAAVQLSFGIKTTNYATAARFFGRVFCPSVEGKNEVAGRKFMGKIFEGNGPAWLMEMLRDYARTTLHWADESTWPRWLMRPFRAAPEHQASEE